MNAAVVVSIALLLLEAALRGTVVLILALGATRLMGRTSAAARHLIWATALAAVVLLPIASRLTPTWQLLPLPVPTSAPAVLAAPPAAAKAGAEDISAPVSTSALQPELTAASSVVRSSPAPAASFGRDVDAMSLAPLGWSLTLALAWLAGACMLLIRLGLGAFRVSRVQKAAVEITTESWVRSVDGLARQLRVGRRVTLLRSARSSVPMTWGLVRPVILLPEAADGWSEERRRSVLAHELAHVRRWDALTQWIAHIATVLFWFHPLVWVAVRKLREERERACDDAVLALGARPSHYAVDLLEIARSQRFSDGPITAMAIARPSQLEGRLLAILDHTVSRAGVTRGLVVATLGVAAAVVVPISAVGAITQVAAGDGLAVTSTYPSTDAATTRALRTSAWPQHADEWTTDMVLSDGRLSYDEIRDGQQWQIGVRGRGFRVQSNGSFARVSVRPSGEVELHERGPGGASRRVHVRADAAGRETRTYYVNGSRRAHDEAADVWTSALLERLNRHLNERSARSSAARSAEERASPANER